MFLKYQAQKLDLSFMCIFSVFIGQKCYVHTCICTDDSCSYAPCMNPDVVFTVFNIVFCVMFIMLGIKFIWVGLLTFGTIRFPHCRYVQ